MKIENGFHYFNSNVAISFRDRFLPAAARDQKVMGAVLGVICLIAAAFAYLCFFPRRGKIDMELPMGDKTKKAVYEGELGFFSGKPKGRGKMRMDDFGSIVEVEGYWDNGNFKGPGRYSIKGNLNGEITIHLGHEYFTFKYVDGKRDGLAKYTFENGDVFEILWVKDICNDKAKLIKKSGEIYEGKWKPTSKWERKFKYGLPLGYIKTYNEDDYSIDLVPVEAKGSHFYTVHKHKIAGLSL